MTTHGNPASELPVQSVSHPFLGDYVRIRQNAQWKKLAAETNDQYVVFADIVNKITRSAGKVSEREVLGRLGWVLGKESGGWESRRSKHCFIIPICRGRFTAKTKVLDHV